jgi:hypothetical protein
MAVASAVAVGQCADEAEDEGTAAIAASRLRRSGDLRTTGLPVDTGHLAAAVVEGVSTVETVTGTGRAPPLSS